MNIDLARVEPEALHVMWILHQAGYEARLAGGAVRDLLLGEAPKDWDIATTALPEQVIDAMAKWEVKVIPTGLQHGTVTAVLEGNYEITTLRADVETDGRHAEVEFISDWREDAARRDFTINAMFIDADGEVHDYFGGYDDLTYNLVRFVGNAEERIQEDYLRILRYFRFRARIEQAFRSKPEAEASGMGGWTWTEDDKDARDAITKHASGLEQISGERIWAEIGKILNYDQMAYATFQAMHGTGVMKVIGLEGSKSRMYNLSKDRTFTEPPAVRLASTFRHDRISDCVDVLHDRFKVSRDELDPIKFTAQQSNSERTHSSIFDMLAKYPRKHVLAWVAIGHNADVSVLNNLDHGTHHGVTPGSVKHGGQFHKLYKLAEGVDIPEFPVSGGDLIENGVPPGPEMGRILRAMRDRWSALEFSPTKEYLLKEFEIHQE